MIRTVIYQNQYVYYILVQYLAYNNGVLFFASKNTVHLLECKHDISSKKTEKRDVTGLKR